MKGLLSILGLVKEDEGTVAPECLTKFHRDRVRMSVIKYPLPCGHVGFGFDLDYRMDDETWAPFATLRDFNLDDTVELLKEAQELIVELEKA